MSLQTYHKKRHFERTPEPRGKPAHGRGALRFVVQKHDASRLHYDFRLELDGALKSWAVPKGPSQNPADKRLAIMVEDHPLDYRTFEGTIPAGNYGAGTVMVWDEGTYHAAESSTGGSEQRALRDGLEQGHVSIVLDGHKLKGGFSLIKTKRGKDNEWLLIKKHDAWASTADVTENDRSVNSGRSLDEIARKLKKARPGKKSQPARKAVRLPPNAPKAEMPRRVKPMLATSVDEPFDRKGWLFEVKWDGYRAIAEVSKHGIALYSRNHISFEHRFQPIVDALRQLGHEAVLDGEVVVIDREGKPHFQLLQNYQKTGKGLLRYFVFDLLYLDGRDLRELPLKKRKELLAKLLDGVPGVQVSEHVEERGKAFFDAVAAEGLEGIIAKNGDSRYREGRRGRNWLKIKIHSRQEAVIGGFTEPRGSRKDLGALVLGVYEGDELVSIGRTGGGFDTQGLSDLRSRLNPLVQKQCPFRKKPKTNAPAHWVEPRLVCEVSFQEWSEDGRMRHPIFVGLREDKPPRSVHREQARPVGEERPREETVSSPEPALTNLTKVFWPDEGYTKGDLISYYREVAPVILPYLRDRPESLNRHPNGISAKSFFQKNVSHQPPPPWVETVSIKSTSGSESIEYVLCQDRSSLLYLANLGCIELNPWSSRVGSLDKPDYLVIDLDPENIPFLKVVEAALAVRNLLEGAGADGFCKTSGKRGLHVFVPLGAQYDYDQARQFAQLVATLVHQQLPGSTSIVRSPAKRQKRVYLDCLQNACGQTLAAPYSVRPYPGATVSTPLAWREVNKGLDPTKFTMKTLPKRLDKVGDLWEPVLEGANNLEEFLAKLGKK